VEFATETTGPRQERLLQVLIHIEQIERVAERRDLLPPDDQVAAKALVESKIELCGKPAGLALLESPLQG
jgi:hypothetical protein